MKILLTPGHRNDITEGPALVDGLHDCEVVGDKGYDSQAFVDLMKQYNIVVNIPPRRTNITQRGFDRASYKARHLIENFFCRIKQHRRVATRYEKTSASYLAMVTLAAMLAWLV